MTSMEGRGERGSWRGCPGVVVSLWYWIGTVFEPNSVRQFVRSHRAILCLEGCVYLGRTRLLPQFSFHTALMYT